jgi:hypothetical protein
MALYLAPKAYKDRIQGYLHAEHPSASIAVQGLSYHEAKLLIAQICEDRTIAQPAVKLLCAHEALKVTAWLGIELHAHADFVEMISADHNKSEFLFYDNGNNRMAEWTLVSLMSSQ